MYSLRSACLQRGAGRSTIQVAGPSRSLLWHPAPSPSDYQASPPSSAPRGLASALMGVQPTQLPQVQVRLPAAESRPGAQDLPIFSSVDDTAMRFRLCRHTMSVTHICWLWSCREGLSCRGKEGQAGKLPPPPAEPSTCACKTPLQDLEQAPAEPGAATNSR